MENIISLKNLLRRFESEAKAGDYYNSIVITRRGEVIYKGHDIGEARRRAARYLERAVEDYFWYDSDIGVEIA